MYFFICFIKKVLNMEANFSLDVAAEIELDESGNEIIPGSNENQNSLISFDTCNTKLNIPKRNHRSRFKDLKMPSSKYPSLGMLTFREIAEKRKTMLKTSNPSIKRIEGVSLNSRLGSLFDHSIKKDTKNKDCPEEKFKTIDPHKLVGKTITLKTNAPNNISIKFVDKKPQNLENEVKFKEVRFSSSGVVIGKTSSEDTVNNLLNKQSNSQTSIGCFDTHDKRESSKNLEYLEKKIHLPANSLQNCLKEQRLEDKKIPHITKYRTLDVGKQKGFDQFKEKLNMHHNTQHGTSSLNVGQSSAYQNQSDISSKPSNNNDDHSNKCKFSNKLSILSQVASGQLAITNPIQCEGNKTTTLSYSVKSSSNNLAKKKVMDSSRNYTKSFNKLPKNDNLRRKITSNPFATNASSKKHVSVLAWCTQYISDIPNPYTRMGMCRTKRGIKNLSVLKNNMNNAKLNILSNNIKKEETSYSHVTLKEIPIVLDNSKLKNKGIKKNQQSKKEDECKISTPIQLINPPAVSTGKEERSVQNDSDNEISIIKEVFIASSKNFTSLPKEHKNQAKKDSRNTYAKQVRTTFKLPISNEVKIRDFEINDNGSKKSKIANTEIRSNKLSLPIITKSKLINEKATKIKNTLVTIEKKAATHCSSNGYLGNREVSNSESCVSLVKNKKSSKNEKTVNEPMNYQLVENSKNSVKEHAIGNIVCVQNEYNLHPTKNCYVKLDTLDLSNYCLIGDNSFQTHEDKLVVKNISNNSKLCSKSIEKVQECDTTTTIKSNTLCLHQNIHDHKILPPDNKIVVKEKHIENINNSYSDIQNGQNNIPGNKSADKQYDYDLTKMKPKPVYKQIETSIMKKINNSTKNNAHDNFVLLNKEIKVLKNKAQIKVQNMDFKHNPKVKSHEHESENSLVSVTKPKFNQKMRKGESLDKKINCNNTQTEIKSKTRLSKSGCKFAENDRETLITKQLEASRVSSSTPLSNELEFGIHTNQNNEATSFITAKNEQRDHINDFQLSGPQSITNQLEHTESMFALKKIVDQNPFETSCNPLNESFEKSNTKSCDINFNNGNNKHKKKFGDIQGFVSQQHLKVTLTKNPRGRPRKRNFQVNNNTQPNLKITQTKNPRGRPRKMNVKVIKSQPNLKATQTKNPRGRPKKRNVQENINKHHLKVKQTKNTVPLYKKRLDLNRLQSNNKLIGAVTNENIDTQEKQTNGSILNKEIIGLKRSSQSSTCDILVKKPKRSGGGNFLPISSHQNKKTNKSTFLSEKEIHNLIIKQKLPDSSIKNNNTVNACKQNSSNPLQMNQQLAKYDTTFSENSCELNTDDLKSVNTKISTEDKELIPPEIDCISLENGLKEKGPVKTKSVNNEEGNINNNLRQSHMEEATLPPSLVEVDFMGINVVSKKSCTVKIKPVKKFKNNTHKLQKNISHEMYKTNICLRNSKNEINICNNGNKIQQSSKRKGRNQSRNQCFNTNQNVNTSIQKTIHSGEIKCKGKLKQVQLKMENKLDSTKQCNLKHFVQHKKHMLNPSVLNKYSNKRNILTKSALLNKHYEDVLPLTRKCSHYKRRIYLAEILRTFRRKISLYKHVYLNADYNNKSLTITKSIFNNQSKLPKVKSLIKETMIISDDSDKLLQGVKKSVSLKAPNISSKPAKRQSSKHVAATKTTVNEENIPEQNNWNTSQCQGNINTSSDNIVKEVVYIHPSYTNSMLNSNPTPVAPLHMIQYPTAITVPSTFFVYSPWNKPINSNILEQQSSHIYLPLSQNSIASARNVMNENSDMMNQQFCKHMQTEAEMYDFRINNNLQTDLKVNSQSSYVTYNAISTTELINDNQSAQTISDECINSNTKCKKKLMPGTVKTSLGLNCNKESSQVIPSRTIFCSTSAVVPSTTEEFHIPKSNHYEADEHNLLHNSSLHSSGKDTPRMTFCDLRHINRSTLKSEVVTSESHKTLVNSKKIMKYMNHLKNVQRSHMIEIKTGPKNNIVNSTTFRNVHEFDISCPVREICTNDKPFLSGQIENNRTEEESIFPLPIITDTFTIVE